MYQCIMYKHLGWLQYLIVIDNASMNNFVHIFLYLRRYIFRVIPKVGLLGQRRNAYVVLLDVAKFPTIEDVTLGSPICSEWVQPGTSSQSGHQSMLLSFKIFANLIGEKYYLSIHSICISLMIKVEHIFMFESRFISLLWIVSSCLLLIFQLNIWAFLLKC